ncbi:Putative glycosyltransferase EpsH [Klebsiella pneumoniae]|nr:Putative glycosyltransferase EpsH [Klebsiella pneumoniae]CAH5019244.1 Putative glycosyltransferase EpsH [Klebsiella pneumoniae]
MSQTPLLSIVAAVYNGEKFLAQFFECIEQQQLDSYELILVNDGSTDNSLAVIAEWQERLQNVQVLEQENQGVSVARNTGLAAASGKYLAFPDIDDKLYPGHCCKVSDEAAFCLIQRPYISKTLLTRRISPRGSP